MSFLAQFLSFSYFYLPGTICEGLRKKSKGATSVNMAFKLEKKCRIDSRLFIFFCPRPEKVPFITITIRGFSPGVAQTRFWKVRESTLHGLEKAIWLSFHVLVGAFFCVTLLLGCYWLAWTVTCLRVG
jgi:hypothetical protein